MAIQFKRLGKVRPSAGSHFPYTQTNVHYFIIENGVPAPIFVDRQFVKDIKSSDPDIYAVWPGKYTSNMFAIDKLELAKAFI
ncbi:hypothetical protein FDI69_gp249 [Rhodococcus phage Trina]|uniref:Uncharacterized protein n=1 Tax=Rhodococcus phage Trina TaxID=2027905 RepID=A0A2D0ZNJ2_9CAUD|nr:hypothetical protein FDI69_gp249 [Rhodococcus phage Trina]ASZ74938.1 hypothetical protein SEA_TRINA_130 [Rhodococcus phage Trina]